MTNRMKTNGSNGEKAKTTEARKGHVKDPKIKIKPVEAGTLRPHPKVIDYDWYANTMNHTYGPFISLGKQHWKWNGNIWKPTDFDWLRKFAVRKQPNGTKSCVVTENILRMLNNITQRHPDEIKWQGAVRFAKANDKIMLSVQNGVVVVGEGINTVLIESNKKDLVTVELPVEYDAQAKCPTFDYLLSSALPDEADRHLLQCFAGYCLLPNHRFQCVLYCYGAPNSGKSLLVLHGIGSMFANDLMSNVSLDDICKGGDGLRAIERSLVNISTEINSKKLEDSSLFNQIACGEPFNKALKYEKDRRLVPNAKHIFIGNHLPRWDRGSDAQARRIRILFFPNDFSGEAKNGKLEKQVKLESNGIFNWALVGLRKILGFEHMPLGSGESQAYAEQFKANNNPLGTFVRKFISFERKANVRIPAPELRSLFRFWCEREGISVGFSDTSKLLIKMNPHIRITSTWHNGAKCKMLLGIKLNEKGEILKKESEAKA